MQKALLKATRFLTKALFVVITSYYFYQSYTSYKQQAWLREHGYLKVIRIIDGDTIVLETGQRVRYIGINTPELSDKRPQVKQLAYEAKQFNSQLVYKKLVRLEKDVSETDKYGRLLRYVYLPDGTFVNLKLVEEGYAFATPYPPDVKYQKLFKTAETQARIHKKGIWGID